MDAIAEPNRFRRPLIHFAEMERRRRIIFSGVAIFLLALTIFLVGIEAPTKLYFDEVHYVPAARAMLDGDAISNTEHPPLAKELMAVGIEIFGDNPFGWRFMSAVFGALAAVGVYILALTLFEDEWAAWWATGVTLCNQVLYVQSRIAMLDIFAIAFMLWALAAFSATWLRNMRARVRLLLKATGAMLGFAIACKWVGVLAWLMVAGTIVVVKVFQRWRVGFDEPSDADWYRSDLWQDVTKIQWLFYLGLIPLAVYYITFLPLGLDQLLPSEFIDAQLTMWRDNATLAGTHPYMSTWTGWPIIARPIWYFFEDSNWDKPDASAQAVLFLGNPLVFWAGIVGVAACLYGWLVARRRDAFLIFATYVALYLAWAAIPRHLTFSFYYLPAAILLGPALGYLFYRTRLRRWPLTRRSFFAACLLMFAYFLPISNAAVLVSEAGYNQLMWFESWR